MDYFPPRSFISVFETDFVKPDDVFKPEEDEAPAPEADAAAGAKGT